MQENGKLKMTGHVSIKDVTDANNEIVLVDDFNAIHYENMSYALAQSLGNKSAGNIERIVFGNGGASVYGTGTVTYLPPNIVGQSADLYNPTFYKIVDNNNTSNSNPNRNYIEISHIPGNYYSDISCTCLLDYGEPSGQDIFDDSATVDGDFIFNEIGIKDYYGNLLSHITFNPVQKSSNRIIQLSYTLRIQMV